ncbi:hypothetical protein H6G81_24130 [Scytonema hofmannii FACHB-248]|uniref:DUF1592 domain-containing protein n=1 Tax=Scytonema hofmannii FACHB-248 TaxID=1842502 RepID=A0ABR8GWJ7_9CYAN|nr:MULTISPECIES: hypothetical protein [Nostocales]MBD2607527.1 hypothetical protein [Scytonema hofmannii FACHB-248]
MPRLGLAKFGTLLVLLIFLLGGSCLLSDIFQNHAIAAEHAQFPTGDFRLRSYLRVTRRFLGSPEGMRSSSMSDPSCEPVVDGKIYRHIAGIDQCVKPMTDDDITTNLNDPFATEILRKGAFPDSVDAISTAILGSGLQLQQRSFVVGEGSQILTTIASREEPRNLRYVISWTPNITEDQIFLSAAPGGNSSFLQLIAWNGKAKKYNFYEFREQVGGTSKYQFGQQVGETSSASAPTKVWSWAGDSAMAQTEPSMGHGCFDCHHNGVVIMKELAFPWNNWHSQLARISPLVVPLAVAQETFFVNRNGAENLEKAVNDGFHMYYENWLRDRLKTEGDITQLSDVNQMLRHIITNTTVNLTSTQIQSNGANTSPLNRDISGIPSDFFLWDSALRKALGLTYNIPAIAFKRQDYDNYLNTHNFKLVQSDFTKPDGSPLYEQKGSTHFSFFIPVPAAEDLFMLAEMRSKNIMTDKFIAAVLMVDFENPVFSEKRSSLQKYADQISTGTITSGLSSVPTDFAAKVRNAAGGQPICDENNFDQCTAEQQFLKTWDLPDDQWKTVVQMQIQSYLNEFQTMTDQGKLDRLMRLSVKRREQFQSSPKIRNLNEFSLLIPQTDISP